MKAWQFLMLASFIFGAPHVSQWLAIMLQGLTLAAAVVAAIFEWRK